MNRLMAVVIAIGLVLGMFLMHGARADDDCVLEAQIFETVLDMAPEDRAALRADVAEVDSRLRPAVVKALNAADAGLSPTEAWLKCGSY